MHENLNTFLVRLSRNEELRNNKLAWTIAKYPRINKNDREKFYDSLLPFYPKIKQSSIEPIEIEKDDESEIINSYSGKDYRLKNINLSNVRGFPAHEKGLFGIDFTQLNQPQSNFILGSNGVGKSSIYAAIEYVFCRRIGEAQLRTNNTDIEDDAVYFKDYLTHFGNSFSDSNIIVSTVNGDYNVHGEIPFPLSVKTKLNPDSHFISDYDIYEFGKYDYEGTADKSFHNLIARSLGLIDYLNFNKLINEFIVWKRRKESNEISKTRKNKELINNDILVWQEEIAKRKVILVDIDKSNTKTDINRDVSISEQALINVKKREINLQVNVLEFTKLVEKYNQTYLEFKGFDISPSAQKEAEFLALGLELIGIAKDCPFCEHSMNSKSEIHLHVTSRIDKIKRYNTIRSELSKCFDSMISFSFALNNKLLEFQSIVVKENEEIKPITDLIPLLNNNELILNTVQKCLNIEYLQNVVSTSIFSLENADKLYDNIINNSKLFIDFIPELIKEFISAKQKRLSIIATAENSIQFKTGSKSSFEQKIILAKEISDYESKIAYSNERNKAMENELLDLNQRYELYSNIQSEAREYAKVLNKEINSIVESAFESIKNVVEKVLNEYLKNDNVYLLIERDDIVDTETGEIVSQVITAKLRNKINTSLPPITPNKYFNTFRYRLFCMMVAISVAIASRKNTNINLPLVLDDVFYASDFEKRTTIIQFIKNLFKLFEDYSNLPLQLIMFTHDEHIFDCALTAMSILDKEKGAIFAKLLPWEDYSKNDKFCELTYRLPNNIPSYDNLYSLKS